MKVCSDSGWVITDPLLDRENSILNEGIYLQVMRSLMSKEIAL
jgi:hypothetical protein